MKDTLIPIIRHAIGFGGGILVGKGIVDQQSAQEVAGALMTLVSVGWSLFEKRKKKE